MDHEFNFADSGRTIATTGKSQNQKLLSRISKKIFSKNSLERIHRIRLTFFGFGSSIAHPGYKSYDQHFQDNFNSN